MVVDWMRRSTKLNGAGCAAAGAGSKPTAARPAQTMRRCANRVMLDNGNADACASRTTDPLLPRPYTCEGTAAVYTKTCEPVAKTPAGPFATGS